MSTLISENKPLARYTSWRIGGAARFFAAVTDADALHTVLEWARERELPTHLLGGGSNTLIREQGFAGLVVRYRAQELVLDEQGALARVSAGAPMAGTARRLAHQGWAGLEWAEGLPGTIGGAVFGNAGCYGGDIAGTLARTWLLTSDGVQEWPVERLEYRYRTSALKEHAKRPAIFKPIVLAAEFKLERADARELEQRMETTAASRRSKTPLGSSCGSVFKNPAGDSAGRLIEAAGLKGTHVGGAIIADKHANYILNSGGASSDDVLRLIEIARERVLREFGVELELEVQIL